MSIRSGQIAAMKKGISVGGIQMGPRGGRFYISASGRKVYGEPPTGRPGAQVGSSPAKMSSKGKRATPPEHLKVGQMVRVDTDEGVIVAKVTKVYTTGKYKGWADFEDEHGTLEAPWAATEPHITTPTKRKKAPEPPPNDGSHIREGAHVEVDMAEEGHMRGKIIKVHPEHVVVQLEDGDEAEVFHEHIRPARQLKDQSQYIKDLRGTEQFKLDTELAIEKGGFAPFLKKMPLKEMREGYPGGGGAYGVYNYDHRITISNHDRMMELQQSFSRRSTEAVGPGTHNVQREYPPEANGVKQAAIVHEISHHLHLAPIHEGMRAGHDPVAVAQRRRWDQAHILDSDIRHHWVRRRDSGWVPSQYARTNHKEWFAEAHTAYVYHRDTFAKEDPTGFALVQRVRQFHGMDDD